MRVFCPHCRTEHDVQEDLAGTRLRCANSVCQQLFTVPSALRKGAGARSSTPSSPGVRGAAPRATEASHDPGMAARGEPPPLPGSPQAVDRLDDHGADSSGTRLSGRGHQDFSLTDMFLGKEKEQVFLPLPGERRVDEVTIGHQHLVIIQRGLTRVTLTTHRVLYTTTRVFSPAYWVALALFFPLLFYYAFRILQNGSVAIPLTSIDSVEKRYWPNWLVLVLSAILAYSVAGLAAFGVMAMVGDFRTNWLVVFAVRCAILGVAGPALLVLLLSIRSVSIAVRSRNNSFTVRIPQFAPGVSEERIDSFLQKMQAEMERAKDRQSRP